MYLPPDNVIEDDIVPDLELYSMQPLLSKFIFDRAVDALLGLLQVPFMTFCLEAIAR
jgi:hypothetical protein